MTTRTLATFAAATRWYSSSAGPADTGIGWSKDSGWPHQPRLVHSRPAERHRNARLDRYLHQAAPGSWKLAVGSEAVCIRCCLSFKPPNGILTGDFLERHFSSIGLRRVDKRAVKVENRQMGHPHGRVQGLSGRGRRGRRRPRAARAAGAALSEHLPALL